jgi:hypothetical protein
MSPLLRFLPAAAIRWRVRTWAPPTPAQIEQLTGLDDEAWRRMAALFPDLGADPGLDAARRRREFALLAAHALSPDSRQVLWQPARPGPERTLYVTVHLGSLRLLRYLLRLAGVPAATVVDETHLVNTAARKKDAMIDRLRAHAFPHVVFARDAHRLKSALGRGSLIMAIDRIHAPSPGRPGPEVAIPFLGGRMILDLSALRLARLARVPARPLFVSAPGGRLTVSVGDPLAADPEVAARQFGERADAVARASPADFDGFTHRFALPEPPFPAGVDLQPRF